MLIKPILLSTLMENIDKSASDAILLNQISVEDHIITHDGLGYLPLEDENLARTLFLTYSLRRLFCQSAQPTVLFVQPDSIVSANYMLMFLNQQSSKSELEIVEEKIVDSCIDMNVSHEVAVNQLLAIYHLHKQQHPDDQKYLHGLLLRIILTFRACFVEFADLCIHRDERLSIIDGWCERQDLLVQHVMQDLDFRAFFSSYPADVEAIRYLSKIKTFTINSNLLLMCKFDNKCIDEFQDQQWKAVHPDYQFNYEIDVTDNLVGNYSPIGVELISPSPSYIMFSSLMYHMSGFFSNLVHRKPSKSPMTVIPVDEETADMLPPR